MEPNWKQRLSYAICAIALVWSLSLYKNQVSANPLSAAQQHWQAIAKANPDLLIYGYSDHAVLKRSYNVPDVNETYQGISIYSAWQDFFRQYDIKDFQVLEQQRRDRTVKAQIQITAKSNQGLMVVWSMSYQADFDQTGKIIKEVWQTNPELGV
ncbi:hypothetical protein [Coleofasciculus sp.]|uniref:hypothetical protein n=1 Tax=Coleofasciculus sp. TaxID=3100458 RepID=UPI003A148178